MRKNKLLTAIFCLLLSPVLVQAQERILSFHSDILIHDDATMTVTETIRVSAAGVNIRRGIFRDFPVRYTDRLGNAYRVGFNVLDVTRDGVPENWQLETLSNQVRLRIGNANIFLSPGEYTYQIQYQTNRQIGFFENHDELYWNVSGNGWDFTIEQASARVTLPSSVSVENITMEGYTGPLGSSGQNYSSRVMSGGGEIETTRPLGYREGLTLVMTWPKGVVSQPTSLQQAGYILNDNTGLLLALATLAGTLFYMFTTWKRVGRDPERGVIFPHYKPPEGYSPASTRYISRMKYDNKTLTAAIINLAVKGCLTISKEGKTYTLTSNSSKSALAPGEKFVLVNLFSKGSTIKLDEKNRKQLLLAASGHRKALRRDYLNKLFHRNTGYLFPSLIISVAMLFFIAVSNNMVPLVIAVFIVIALLHIPFAILLKAPSKEGRHLMDKLEGFKLYLEVAEKDDLNLRHPPELTPQLFEQYLPFAVALGVEQAWAEQFSKVFAALQAQTGTAYHPIWYHGVFSTHHMNNFTKDIGKGFATAIATASAPPASASGAGGGGFSGGGGGGGGGGGW